MSKSADAFRTISEVADWLGVQPHVLRFWESKFTQVKPVKRAGGRRYYRPTDMLLLGGIRKLLHEDGLTIKGVQKIIREEGIHHVADLSPSLDEDLSPVSFDDPEADHDVSEIGQQDMFAGARSSSAADRDEAPEAEDDAAPMAEDVTPEPATVTDLPSFLYRKQEGSDAAAAPAEPAPEPQQRVQPEPQASPETGFGGPGALPSFLKPDTPASSKPADAPASDLAAGPDAQPEPAPPPRPRVIDAPDPDDSALAASPGALSAACRITHLTPAQRRAVTPLLARLAAHRDQLAASSTQTGAH